VGCARQQSHELGKFGKFGDSGQGRPHRPPFAVRHPQLMSMSRMRCGGPTSRCSAKACIRQGAHVRPRWGVLAASPSTAVAAQPAPVSATTDAVAYLLERFRLLPVFEQFKETRSKLCREWLSGGLLYLEAGTAPPRNGSDVSHRHRSNSNFVYATGCEQPGFAALIDAETGPCPRLRATRSHSASGPTPAVAGQQLSSLQTLPCALGSLQAASRCWLLACLRRQRIG
jgi:hypothetical protein